MRGSVDPEPRRNPPILTPIGLVALFTAPAFASPPGALLTFATMQFPSVNLDLGTCERAIASSVVAACAIACHSYNGRARCLTLAVWRPREYSSRSGVSWAYWSARRGLGEDEDVPRSGRRRTK